MQSISKLIVAATIITLGVQSRLAMGDYPSAIGEAHPDFVLPRIDNGEAVRLADFRGKRVLLVHFASW